MNNIHVQQLFIVFYNVYYFDQRIYSDIINKVVDVVASECSFRRELPALMKLMNRPRINDPNLQYLGEMSGTTYRDTFGKETIIDFREPRSAEAGMRYTRHEPNEKEAQLTKAAKILCAGTIKGTYQLPGYRGHIPMNVRNNRKLDHSMGLQPHHQQSNVGMSITGMGTVLGYTGTIIYYYVDYYYCCLISFKTIVICDWCGVII